MTGYAVFIVRAYIKMGVFLNSHGSLAKKYSIKNCVNIGC
jgi:hypothetical protein